MSGNALFAQTRQLGGSAADDRHIRLKEISPSTSRTSSPSESYRSYVDETLEAGPFLCRTDNNGFIITGNTVRSQSEKLVFLGDSFVESIFSHETDRFVSDTERRLTASGIPLRCLNAGYSGSTSLQLVNDLLNKIYPIVGPGGSVLFFVPQSDVKLLGDPASYWNSTALYAPIVPPAVPEASGLEPGLENTRRVLQIMAAVAQSLEIRLVLVASPYRSAPLGQDDWLARRLRGDSYHRLLGWRSDLVDVVSSVASDLMVPFIDAAAYMRNRPDCFYDELHLNAKGQKVFSAWITDAILELPGFLKHGNESLQQGERD